MQFQAVARLNLICSLVKPELQFENDEDENEITCESVPNKDTIRILRFFIIFVPNEDILS